ncbi:hypothetical protein [uncultured Oscillibacter sp.]|jgi:rubrerythrin|uniref:hypothetical protein n=1 Tax=uncultured Oscillibacter sp. TaxID=876091 RepID=UPI00216C4A10|nr:hypothetical protein [uncultured Oscillibacter sp.]MCI9554422.1 hypothetical protein [Oscillibacter sp.]
MTLKQKELVSAAVLIAGLLLMLIGGESIWVLLLGLAVALGAVVLWKRWWRCPSCGRFLGRTKGQYCPHCGKEIDYNAEK